jgi:hypothetical protein
MPEFAPGRLVKIITESKLKDLFYENSMAGAIKLKKQLNETYHKGIFNNENGCFRIKFTAWDEEKFLLNKKTKYEITALQRSFNYAVSSFFIYSKETLEILEKYCQEELKESSDPGLEGYEPPIKKDVSVSDKLNEAMLPES